MRGSGAYFTRQANPLPSRAFALNWNSNKNQLDVEDQADLYSTFVCELAKKFTNSTEEAEAAVEEMFSDIQRWAEKSEGPKTFEDRLKARIALRRLLKFLEQPDKRVYAQKA